MPEENVRVAVRVRPFISFYNENSQDFAFIYARSESDARKCMFPNVYQANYIVGACKSCILLLGY